jgi:hypothetical protein
MSKRSSNFKKIERDFYPSIDPKIGEALVSHIRGVKFGEPFYGNGDLEDQLMDAATCVWRSDIRETVGCSKVLDALEITEDDLKDADCIVSNPPYTWRVLQPLLDHLVPMKPCWFLLPMDMLSNKYMKPYGQGSLQMVVPVGRLYWFLDEGKTTGTRGTDNYGWFYFEDRGTVSDNTVRVIY